MNDTPKDQEELTEEEAAKRRDAVLKKMLETPPKPHKLKPSKNGEKSESG
ncbi:MAG: hypothetical protein ISR48_06475 [Alphaproteobacteria bacterium]|nr:hypothetical protein [Alphaproteobacteria bacterium]